MNRLKSINTIAIVFILASSFFALKPLFADGFFSMHDETQIARVFVMAEALRDGQIPVRVVEHLGYDLGYFIFNFYAPFAYYLGAVFVLMGVSAVLSTKLMIGSGIILAGIFMYLFAREFWGKLGGIFSGVLYIYAPYHGVNAYVRGAIGELWAYAFIPLMFFGFYKLFTVLTRNEGSGLQKAKIWKYIIIAAVGYAGIILSHNLTAMMVTPFILLLFIVYYFLFIRRKQLFAIRYLLYALFLGLGLSMFYFMPALLEMRYVNIGSILGGGSDFRDHFLCPFQLWSSPWGYGGSVPGCIDGMSFQLGKLHIFFSVLTLISLPWFFFKEKSKFYILGFILSGLIFVLFLTFSWSKPVWEFFSPMEYFQFPWRFLVLIAFCLSFFSGGVVYLFSQIMSRRKYVVVGILLLVIFYVVIFYSRFFAPQFIRTNPQSQLDPEIIRYDISRISDEYLPSGILVPKNKSETQVKKTQVLKGNIQIDKIKSTSNLLSIAGNITSPVTLVFNKAYFPGWTLYLNGEKHPYTISEGKIKTVLPSGKTKILLKFEQTPTEKIANTVSLISFIIVGIGTIKIIKINKNE